MAVAYLHPENPVFPHYTKTDHTGIIAVGGNIFPETLLLAYSQGIFPWYNDDFPIWWHPDPRFVLFPQKLKVSKSMRPYFNQAKFKVTYNEMFGEVIKKCKEVKRKGQPGTWLNDEMIWSYTCLHDMGYAHSVEVWNENDQLVGGLYGVAIGKVFFGESMFTEVSNASKFGFISLVKELRERDFLVIDCQQETPHLLSLGADSICRKKFMKLLEKGKGIELGKLKVPGR